MSFNLTASVETSDIAWAIGTNQETAFDLIVRVTEMIADTEFDERVIAMLKEA